MKNILYILSILLFVSCTSNTIYEKPKNVIPKDTMVVLINDLLIAKSAKNQKNKNLEIKVDYLPLVYNKYKIDSTRFTASNLYYTSKIEVYEELVLSVKEKLTKQNEKYTAELTIKDSIEREKRKTLKKEKMEEFSKKEKGNKLILEKKLLKKAKDTKEGLLKTKRR